jgi:hypothetical protein
MVAGKEETVVVATGEHIIPTSDFNSAFLRPGALVYGF